MPSSEVKRTVPGENEIGMPKRIWMGSFRAAEIWREREMEWKRERMVEEKCLK